MRRIFLAAMVSGTLLGGTSRAGADAITQVSANATIFSTQTFPPISDSHSDSGMWNPSNLLGPQTVANAIVVLPPTDINLGDSIGSATAKPNKLGASATLGFNTASDGQSISGNGYGLASWSDVISINASLLLLGTIKVDEVVHVDGSLSNLPTPGHGAVTNATVNLTAIEGPSHGALAIDALKKPTFSEDLTITAPEVFFENSHHLINTGPINVEFSLEALLEGSAFNQGGINGATLDASHTASIVGFELFDANNNPLPANLFWITSDSGYQYQVIDPSQPVPEPSSCILLSIGAGLLCCLWQRGRFRRATEK